MIRNAFAKDSVEICRIYNYYVQNSIATFEDMPVTPTDMRNRITKTTSKFPWLVSEMGENLIGFAYATDWKQRAAYKFTVESTIYIDHEKAGNGFGKELYNELISMLKKFGFKQAIASIALPNEASVKLHEQLGYKKSGILRNVGLKFGQWIDVGYWQLEI